MHTQTKEAGDWWARSRGPDRVDWIATYQRSLHHRHRNQLVEILKTLQPTTLLEVGCHCGPNLVRFAREFPELRMLGVDINQEAITAGQSWVKGIGFADRIQLNAGRVPAVTGSVPTGACDVVLSCYALAYIAPADLDAVLYEMGRIATKAILIAEPMTMEGPTPAGVRAISGYNEWAHNYQAAAKWIGTWHGRATTIVPIAPPVDRLNAILVAQRGES